MFKYFIKNLFIVGRYRQAILLTKMDNMTNNDVLVIHFRYSYDL